MSFRLIQGKFCPDFGKPDGDSVRFTPNKPELFDALEEEAGRRLKKTTDEYGRDSVQLRYEAVDALEKDAIPPLPKQALDLNLKLLGYRESNPEPSGYILTKGIEKNGRPICFVFSGESEELDGEIVYLKGPQLRKSVNFKLAKSGLVYPMYYMSLYAELRLEFSTIIYKAQEEGLGIWSEDKSLVGFSFKTKADVCRLPPIFPKLYRRLQDSSATSVDGFLEELDYAAERVAIMSEQRFVRFNDVLTKKGAKQIKMLYRPEDLVFQES
jgi:hypothetical protein